jgi:hypothetical protein
VINSIRRDGGKLNSRPSSTSSAISSPFFTRRHRNSLVRPEDDRITSSTVHGVACLGPSRRRGRLEAAKLLQPRAPVATRARARRTGAPENAGHRHVVTSSHSGSSAASRIGAGSRTTNTRECLWRSRRRFAPRRSASMGVALENARLFDETQRR